MDERTAFFRFSGATNLIQDQISTEMAIHIGQKESRMERINCSWHVFYFACGFNNWMFFWLYKEYKQL
jgi:hypothetical protein